MAYGTDQSTKFSKGKRFVDLDYDFKANPLTGDVVLKTNDQAIKNSVRALLNTNKYDRVFQPSIQSRLRKLLFEQITPLLGINIKSNIEDVIRLHEPRVQIQSIVVNTFEDQNAIEITIQYNIINEEQISVLSVTMERSR